MRIKICGLKRVEDIEAANLYQPDYVGFVFAKSKRQVSLEDAVDLRGCLDQTIQTVGVFVNAPIEDMLECYNKGAISIVQLHGQEDESVIRALKQSGVKTVIKAVSMKEGVDLSVYDDSEVDYLLLDQGAGGTGQCFDWKLITNCKKPYFLAGGLNINNVEAAMKSNAYALDVSGGVETDGYKDAEKIREMIQFVRSHS